MSEAMIGFIMMYVCSVVVSALLHAWFRGRPFGFLRACFWATLVGPVLFLLLAHIISGPEAFLPIAFVVSILYTFFVPPLVGIFMPGLTRALGRTPSCKHEEAEGKGATGSAGSRSSGRAGVSVAHTTYPNIARGLKAGLIGGGFVGLLWFLVCCWATSWPAPTPVSLSLAFRLWWGNWLPALIASAVGFVLIGALAALRPVAGKKRLARHQQNGGGRD